MGMLLSHKVEPEDTCFWLAVVWLPLKLYDLPSQRSYWLHDETILAWSNEHLKRGARTINTPRYLTSLTHWNSTSFDNDIGRHDALCLGPMRIQTDLRVLIAVSSNFSSYSHVLTNDSRPHTEGAINKISSAYNTILKPRVDEHEFLWAWLILTMTFGLFVLFSSSVTGIFFEI